MFPSVEAPQTLYGHSVTLDLARPCMVGILNVTPDSFSDGGLYQAKEQAIQQARRMVDEGAGLIDIGGESTRPGAPQVSVEQELSRVLPVIEALHGQIDAPLSIDTTKSAVASAAVAAGAEFVNDISGLIFDAEMASVIAQSGAGLIAMHTRGRPETMQRDTVYDDVVAEVCDGLRHSLKLAESAGIARDKIALDPGIGFGKDVGGNLELLRRLDEINALGHPVMLGTSRKSFIGRVLGQDDPKQRLAGTLATIALGVASGVKLFRVHDVAAAR
ncbi:MAG: dihydropteroate synthase, partial [Desulfuromonadales bacterium]|nr:dihydropteroate synthase [Desulfuromonadales bacterium]